MSSLLKLMQANKNAPTSIYKEKMSKSNNLLFKNPKNQKKIIYQLYLSKSTFKGRDISSRKNKRKIENNSCNDIRISNKRVLSQSKTLNNSLNISNFQSHGKSLSNSFYNNRKIDSNTLKKMEKKLINNSNMSNNINIKISEKKEHKSQSARKGSGKNMNKINKKLKNNEDKPKQNNNNLNDEKTKHYEEKIKHIEDKKLINMNNNNKIKTATNALNNDKLKNNVINNNNEDKTIKISNNNNELIRSTNVNPSKYLNNITPVTNSNDNNNKKALGTNSNCTSQRENNSNLNEQKNCNSKENIQGKYTLRSLSFKKSLENAKQQNNSAFLFDNANYPIFKRDTKNKEVASNFNKKESNTINGDMHKKSNNENINNSNNINIISDVKKKPNNENVNNINNLNININNSNNNKKKIINKQNLQDKSKFKNIDNLNNKISPSSKTGAIKDSKIKVSLTNEKVNYPIHDKKNDIKSISNNNNKPKTKKFTSINNQKEHTTTNNNANNNNSKQKHIKNNLSSNISNIGNLDKEFSLLNEDIKTNLKNTSDTTNQENANLITKNTSISTHCNISNTEKNLRNSHKSFQNKKEESNSVINIETTDNGQVVKTIKTIHNISKTGLSGDEKKINQDNYFIFQNFNGNFDYIFMGVCDGHGFYGQEVSGYIRENLPMNLNHIFKKEKININDESQTSLIHESIKKAFIQENENLLTNKNIDSKLSGTTCVSVIYTPKKLLIANIGDSRAVLGKKSSSSKIWTCENLSRDHKPSLQEEADRIKQKGGRIRPMMDEDGSFIGPLRVYMKTKDIPGLAMTRSFGDYYASLAGTISEPEITEHVFNAEDKFLVIASDGLYEFISSEEVVQIVGKYYEKEEIVECCEYLYKESCNRWLKEEEDIIDDITIILVFFN